MATSPPCSGLLARRRRDQAFLRRRDAPRLGSKAAKGETRGTDFSAYGVHDRGDGNQRESALAADETG